MSSISVARLPTLTALHRAGKFLERLSGSVSSVSSQSSSPSSTPPFAPSRTLNDRIAYFRGDITKLEVDAIVNAANNSLLGGGGVDGVIHRAAGRELVMECATLDGCDTGEAKITNGYRLPARKVIHTVGPVYFAMDPTEAAQLLASCYHSSLAVAVENECRSVAFCAISTGIYGYPSLAAARVAASTVRAFLAGPDGDKIDKVVFVTFDMKDVRAYEDALAYVVTGV